MKLRRSYEQISEVNPCILILDSDPQELLPSTLCINGRKCTLQPPRPSPQSAARAYHYNTKFNTKRLLLTSTILVAFVQSVLRSFYIPFFGSVIPAVALVPGLVPLRDGCALNCQSLNWRVNLSQAVVDAVYNHDSSPGRISC